MRSIDVDFHSDECVNAVEYTSIVYDIDIGTICSVIILLCDDRGTNTTTNYFLTDV